MSWFFSLESVSLGSSSSPGSRISRIVAGWDDAGRSAVAWIGDLSVIQGAMMLGGLIALALLAVEGWVLVQFLQQNGRLLLRLDALEAAVETGKPIASRFAAPAFDLPDVHGVRISLDILTSSGDSALLIRPDGTIGSPLAMVADTIRRIVSQTVGAPAPARAVPVSNGKTNGSTNGTGLLDASVADLKLATMEGEEATLASFAGEPMALFFWNPGWGFCNRMPDDLKEVEANPADGAPRIELISNGDPERNRAMGVQSAILLDEGFTAGRAFGATGTPSTVLIDAEGRVASVVAVGAPGVLSLVEITVPAGA